MNRLFRLRDIRGLIESRLWAQILVAMLAALARSRSLLPRLSRGCMWGWRTGGETGGALGSGLVGFSYMREYQASAAG